MALSRASVEQVLVKRAGKFLEKAGMAVTYSGANDDLNDPIGWALRQAGYSVGDITNVADSDLTAVVADDTDRLLDLAEYRTLENVLGNLTLVNVKLGPRSEDLSDLAGQIETKLNRLKASLAISGPSSSDSTSPQTGATPLWITL